MTREEIEEFIAGIEGSIVLTDELFIPGIDNGFVGWDGWGERIVYDWKLCLSGLVKSMGKDGAEDHLNRLRQQAEDLAKEGGYNPPVFIDTP
tara:strand:- start:12800 stop:13075 length:276 start_codon:yes stop_codon:yes gene_type:complete